MLGKIRKYVGGGLLAVGGDGAAGLCAPKGWVAPKWIDLRSYCLPSDDQGNEPHCAAYAMAGWLEVNTWRKTHFPRGVNPLPIYEKAKTIDNINGDGTTLEAVVNAARLLRLIGNDVVVKKCTSLNDLMFALHQDGVLLWGFRVDGGWGNASNQTGWIQPGGRWSGGHAVLVCWYSTEQGTEGVGFQNSWGKSWGVNGFGRIHMKNFDLYSMGGLAITTRSNNE